MEIDQEIRCLIERIGSQGDGIGKIADYNIIIPKTTTGDMVKARIRYITEDRAQAELLEIITPGQARQKAPCKHYNDCGGCNLQHINQPEYKSYKLNLLQNELENNKIIYPKISWFSVEDKSRRRVFIRFDNGKLGFYAQQSHKVVDIDDCLVMEEELSSLLEPIKAMSQKLPCNIEGYTLTLTDNGIDIMLHIKGQTKAKEEGNLSRQLANFAKENKISRLLVKNGQKILPIITLARPFIEIADRQIYLPEEYFIQASKKGQQAILDAVTAHIKPKAKVIDLYSGLGVYSFAIADKATKIGSYEIAQKMVDCMEENVRNHKLSDKITAYSRDIDTYPLSHDEIAKYDIAIVNPPRMGALKQIKALAAAKIPEIVIVSCNSHTFARDAKILKDNDYKLVSLNAIDQFFYSNHLEQVGYWKK